MTRRWLPLAMVGFVATLAACGGSGTTAAPTVSATPEASASRSAATEAEPRSDEPLDLVLLADSGGGGVAEPYAALASEALGREVRVHDHHIGGATADQLLSLVRYGASDDVAGAEIVLFYVNPGGYEPPSHLTCLEALDAVGGDPDYAGPTWAPGQSWDPPVVTAVGDWQGYREVLDEVYDEIWRLRAGQPTILRAYGAYMPWLSQWRQVGIASECMSNEEAVDSVRVGAAEAAGAVYVSMLDVFNGPGHDEDPVEKGLIDDDGMHLNEAGQAVLVEALADVGFEVSQPPR